MASVASGPGCSHTAFPETGLADTGRAESAAPEAQSCPDERRRRRAFSPLLAISRGQQERLLRLLCPPAAHSQPAEERPSLNPAAIAAAPESAGPVRNWPHRFGFSWMVEALWMRSPLGRECWQLPKTTATRRNLRPHSPWQRYWLRSSPRLLHSERPSSCQKSTSDWR